MANDDESYVTKHEIWYKLNMDKGTAKISYKEPSRGNWKSLDEDEVTESTIILYKGQETNKEARIIFSCTHEMSNDHILKPLTCTWNKSKGAWIIFYPAFTAFQRWWTSELENARGSYSEMAELRLWLVKNLRKILRNLIQAHANGVAHGDPSDTSEFAIVSEGVVGRERSDVKLMLTNLRIRRDKETEDDWKIKCFDELKKFITAVQSLIPWYRKHDSAIIITYMDQIKFLTVNKSEEILSFPFWKSADKRLKVFFDADKSLKLNFSLVSQIANEVRQINAFKLPWNGKFGHSSMEDNEVERGLKKIYHKNGRGSYQGNDLKSLVAFLRDVYIHATNRGIYEEYDEYINKNYPGFVSIVHQCCFT